MFSELIVTKKNISIEPKQSYFWWGNENELKTGVGGDLVGQIHQSLLSDDSQKEQTQ
jgi:hypothetical protein